MALPLLQRLPNQPPTMRFSIFRHSARSSCAPRRSCSNVSFWDSGEPLQGRAVRHKEQSKPARALVLPSSALQMAGVHPRTAPSQLLRLLCSLPQPVPITPRPVAAAHHSLGHEGNSIDAPLAPAALQLRVNLRHRLLAAKAKVDVGPAGKMFESSEWLMARS